jgi:hypothetical protein
MLINILLKSTINYIFSQFNPINFSIVIPGIIMCYEHMFIIMDKILLSIFFALSFINIKNQTYKDKKNIFYKYKMIEC